jgi:hypothetical protein
LGLYFGPFGVGSFLEGKRIIDGKRIVEGKMVKRG